MNRKKILSNFFLVLLILTIIGFSYDILKRHQSTIDLKSYQAIERNLATKEKNFEDDLVTNEESIKTKSTELNNMTIEIKDNKNIPLLNEIEDYSGWIAIENSKINYPVVKAKDNSFYLTHDYSKEKSDSGAIFMDRRNIGNIYDKHTIIYGHNMKDGSMFKDLNKYLDKDFFNSNDLIRFEDLYNDYEYKVISAYYISANDYTIALEIEEDTIKSFLGQSIHQSNYEYDEEDRFLTLATCNYLLSNGRMIVHAVLID